MKYKIVTIEAIESLEAIVTIENQEKKTIRITRLVFRWGVLPARRHQPKNEKNQTLKEQKNEKTI